MEYRANLLIGGTLVAFFIAITLAYWVRTHDTGSPISSATASKTLYAKKGTQRGGARALVRTKNVPAPSRGGRADPDNIEIWGSLEPGGYQPDSSPQNSEFQTLDQIQNSSFSGRAPSPIISEDTPVYSTSNFPDEYPDTSAPVHPVNETYLNAKRLFQKGEYREAQRLLEPLDTEDNDTSLSPGEAEHGILLALIHSKQGHAEEGIAMLREIMHRTESAKGVRDQQLVQAYRQAAIHLARLLRTQGRRNEADSVSLDPTVVGAGAGRSGSVSR